MSIVKGAFRLKSVRMIFEEKFPVSVLRCHKMSK